MNPSFYFAAAFPIRSTLVPYARQLESVNCRVTSRWLYQADHLEALPLPSDNPREYAIVDYSDLLDADNVIVFTGTPSSTGGYHVELGIALQAGKRVFIIGPRTNVFHYLIPDTQVYQTWDVFFYLLTANPDMHPFRTPFHDWLWERDGLRRKSAARRLEEMKKPRVQA